MHTLRSAAALLAGSSTALSLAPIAAALGCESQPAPLDGAAARELGIPEELSNPHIAAGKGSLRALLVETRTEGQLPALVARLAARLAARAPHLLWIIVATECEGSVTALAAWPGDLRPPRIAALVVDRRRIVDSDAETLCALTSADGAVDVLVHARWLDVLGREALTRRFYRALVREVAALAAAGAGRASGAERREVALLYVSRLIFLAFLEAKRWLDADRAFLAHGFERCMDHGGGYHRRVLLPLFFGTLNTPRRKRAHAARQFGRVPFLNGGLFAPSPLERRCRLLFPDDALGSVFGELLGRYRFTAREDRASWSEAAIDPEMLGKAFESLMGSPARRMSGAFYTPQAMVEEVTTAALMDALGGAGVSTASVAGALGGHALDPRESSVLRHRLQTIRILDPACGSGAFLVHALERLAALGTRLGDDRPIAMLRREVLTQSIFGVDINPTAVWLCELRLWLSMVIESDDGDPESVVPLPNLDHHIRVGDSLAGNAFGDAAAASHRPARLTILRERYARASGARKTSLGRALEREERARAIVECDAALERVAALRLDVLAVQRSRDLFGERARIGTAERARLGALRQDARALRASRRLLSTGGALPFSFGAHFADVAAKGGFDVVLGNPPWVRLHRIPRAARAALRRRYSVFREAAWAKGASAAQAGAGFAAQADLAAVFVERSLALTRERGTMALILPAKLWKALAGGGLRRLLAREAELRSLDDWSESRHTFDAAVYPSVLVARRGSLLDAAERREVGNSTSAPPAAADQARRVIACSHHRRDDCLRWTLPTDALPFDSSPGSPWLLVPPEVRAAFDRVARAGSALSHSRVARPTLGVKCGCNAAFVVSVVSQSGDIAVVRSGTRRGEVERELLRPVVRGAELSSWSAHGEDHIIWTHDERGRPLERLPPGAARWLAPWRSRLTRRADGHGGTRWWSLFRTESARSSQSRVVWADFGRSPRAAVMEAGDPSVALNSCYVSRCRQVDDALTLAAILNSPLAAAWLDVVAEPARGGYRRYLAWTMTLLPLPRNWSYARVILAPLARPAHASGQSELPPGELLEAVLRAYELTRSEVAPLLAWSGR